MSHNTDRSQSACASRRRHRRLLPVLAAIALSASHVPRPAPAAVSTWTGHGADDNWSTPLNWSPAAIPPNDGSADIVLDGYTRTSPVTDAPWSINALTFAPGSDTFTLTGSSVSIGAGGVTNQSTRPQRVSNNLALDADQTWDLSGNSQITALSFLGAVDANGRTWTITGDRGGSLQGAISGSLHLVVEMNSAGILLSGPNTYTGDVTVNRGWITLYDGRGLGQAATKVTLNGGQLIAQQPLTLSQNINLGPNGGALNAQLAQYQVLAVGGSISGPGSLHLIGRDGSSYVSLSGQNTYTGSTLVDGVGLRGTTASLQGDIAFTGAYPSIEFGQDFDGEFSGNLSGAGRIIKTGAGLVRLTGANSVQGAVAIYGGILQVTSGSLPAGVAVELRGDAVLQVEGPSSFIADPRAVTWSGAGGFAARNGKLTVNIGGSDKPFHIRYPLIFGSPSANAATEFQTPIAMDASPSSDPVSIRVDAGTGGDYATLSAPVSGISRLEKDGNGTLELSAVNTFTGGLMIAGGAVQARDGVGLPQAAPLAFSGGVLLSDATTAFSRPLGTAAGQVRWTGDGGFAAGDGTFTVNILPAGSTLTWGAPNFVPTGSALLLGAARADGQTLFVNSINLGTEAREIRVDAGLGNDSATLLGRVLGAGGLNKTGGGRLRLIQANSYTGGTTISGGILIVDGSLAAGNVIVKGGGALAGRGSIAGPVSVAGGFSATTIGSINLLDGQPGVLRLTDPAASDVVLSLGGTAGYASILNFEVGAGSDRILIQSGKLVVNPGGAVIYITPLDGLQPGVYDLIDFGDGQAKGLGNITLATSRVMGYQLRLRSTPTAEQLVVVPEPGAVAFALMTAAAFLVRRPQGGSRA